MGYNDCGPGHRQGTENRCDNNDKDYAGYIKGV